MQARRFARPRTHCTLSNSEGRRAASSASSTQQCTACPCSCRQRGRNDAGGGGSFMARSRRMVPEPALRTSGFACALPCLDMPPRSFVPAPVRRCWAAGPPLPLLPRCPALCCPLLKQRSCRQVAAGRKCASPLDGPRVCWLQKPHCLSMLACLPELAPRRTLQLQAREQLGAGNVMDPSKPGRRGWAGFECPAPRFGPGFGLGGRGQSRGSLNGSTAVSVAFLRAGFGLLVS